MDIVIERPPLALEKPKTKGHLRLSVALEANYTQHLLVPTFAEGTRISLRAASFTTADLDLQVFPVDLEKRALCRVLAFGLMDEARAVFQDILKHRTFEDFIRDDADPWAATVVALLAVRFPQLSEATDIKRWTDSLLNSYPWLPDVHILAARCFLACAPDDPEGRRQAFYDSVNALTRSRVTGEPYFSFANGMAVELLNGLCGVEIEPGLDNPAKLELKRWRLRAPTQGHVGLSFSWKDRSYSDVYASRVLK